MKTDREMTEEDVAGDDTFITAVQQITPSASDEPSAMAYVREQHTELCQVVSSLSDKITKVLGRQEQDFLAAYRAHMYSVQRDLHEMREKLRQSETVENRNEKLKKVEDERDWYRKEALRLDAFTTSLTKDLQVMRDKLEAIEEDRDWLETQLKACKKQNKVLRAEVENKASEATCLPAFDGGKSLASSKKADRNESSSSALPYLLGQDKWAVKKEENETSRVKGLKKQLALKSSQLLTAQRQIAALADKKHHSRLEILFVQCVESVRAEVRRRKQERNANLSHGSLPLERGRNQTLEVDDLDQFTSTDRVHLIEKLLAHDEVLSLLYDHLFPTEKTNEDRTISQSSISKSTPSLQDSSELIPADRSVPRPTTQESGHSTGLRLDASTRSYLQSVRPVFTPE